LPPLHSDHERPRLLIIAAASSKFVLDSYRDIMRLIVDARAAGEKGLQIGRMNEEETKDFLCRMILAGAAKSARLSLPHLDDVGEMEDDKRAADGEAG
jgi:hypothetical protein